ncbi:MAG TPA: hypothetical protein PLN21_19545 [Gemmatales bacterium]|nr:hypothetical protein [Gemmatales bacterium]
MQVDPDHIFWHSVVGLFFATLATLLLYFAGNMVKSFIDPASDIVRYDVRCQRFFFKDEEYQATVMELNREGYYQVDYQLQK